MGWRADLEHRRTFDPDSGLELYFVSSGSDGFSRCEIRSGDEVIVPFSASMSEFQLTDQEKEELGISDASVWYVPGGDQAPFERRKLIFEALTATKWAHGFSPSGNPVFVRLGRGTIVDPTDGPMQEPISSTMRPIAVLMRGLFVMAAASIGGGALGASLLLKQPIAVVEVWPLTAFGSLTILFPTNIWWRDQRRASLLRTYSAVFFSGVFGGIAIMALLALVFSGSMFGAGSGSLWRTFLVDFRYYGMGALFGASAAVCWILAHYLTNSGAGQGGHSARP